jgi:hypothetical protein
MRGAAVMLTAALVWFISIEGAEARLEILVDKASQRMLVMQDGYVRYIWPVSTGRDSMQTPNGIYTPQRLERNWSSSAYYDSPMPHAIFFYNGYAIHGSYAIDRLGGPASHGCVRLHPHHAAVLFDLVQLEGPDKTTIEVTDDGRGPEQAPMPGREVTAGPGVNPPVPGTVYTRDSAGMPNLPPPQRGNRLIAAKNALPPKPMPVTEDGRLGPPASPRGEIAGGPGVNPFASRKMQYRDSAGMPDLPPLQPGNRLLAARNPIPPPRSTAPPRAPYGAGGADKANVSARPSGEFSDSRPRSKVAEGPSELAQHAPSNRSYKVLPASCWWGGASRWQWWASSEGTSCK